ncbi:MAG: beta-class phenol-soluble modulin [Staphylococcus warneri]|nr:beta-class phenol-soluble modulin [Staphylococcus warneri]
MTKLAEAIANTVQAAQGHDGAKLGTSIVSIVEGHDGAKLGTSIVSIVENGVSVLGKLFVF